ncbi:MAG: tRNA preQ1(34) S-adenosylmethionine ribosyltransferase-isomerase QueA [Pseudomonadota bacterium]
MTLSLSEFDYALPERLIAQTPASERTDSRLLVVHPSGELVDEKFSSITNYLRAGDLLVLNDTRVIPARLIGKKSTGGAVEILLERIIDEHQILAQVRASRSPKQGQAIIIDGATEQLQVVDRDGSFFILAFTEPVDILRWLQQHGSLPLPPYISRSQTNDDSDRYQTVFGKVDGAVAAPTAGLHYSTELLAKIESMGVRIAKITLHVGAGTFQPVRDDDIRDHQMHSEWVEVNQATCQLINAAKSNGGRVVAVGTTCVRALESAGKASQGRTLEPFSGDTAIFIYPGFEFNVVDCLQTNFHLPKSTLLMLVSAFSGKATVFNAYQHAIEQEYRFFSYGDAMFLHLSTA